ncbi:hypothetical protein WISP_104300 [Willisornis vidua]|uniref:Uncharacterized protein n=1 Tax=Willisornis vidua TaxID=1566151 RepID=A0ABQ9D226_9PASS|nr:hypothetical protein WISP_104300 [Willisornis vidua]
MVSLRMEKSSKVTKSNLVQTTVEKRRSFEQQTWEKDLGVLVGEAGNGPAQPPLCPGLVPQSGQEDRTGRFCPSAPQGETPPAELLQPWGQHRKDMELLESPEEAPGWPEDGAALLGGKAGRAGIVQPGEEKVWGDLPEPEGTTRKMERDHLQGMERPFTRDRTRGNGFTLIESKVLANNLAIDSHPIYGHHPISAKNTAPCLSFEFHSLIE